MHSFMSGKKNSTRFSLDVIANRFVCACERGRVTAVKTDLLRECLHLSICVFKGARVFVW